MSQLRFHRLLPFCLALIAVTPARAASPPRLERFDTLLSIQDDGSAIVIENFEMLSSVEPVWTISTVRVGPVGSSRHLDVSLLTVENFNGDSVPYTQRDFSDRIELRLPRGPIKLTYLVQNLTMFHSDRDDIFWIPGEAGLRDRRRHGGHGPLQALTLAVKLPDRAAGEFTTQTFLSRGSSLSPVAAQTQGTLAQVEYNQPLAAADDLIIHVSLPPGILQHPSQFVEARWFLHENPVVLFPLIVATILVLAWKIKHPLDPVSVAPRYEPPQGMTPAEVGVLVNDSFDPRDVTATLMDLAVRGYIRIEQGTPDEGIAFPGQDFILRLLKPMEQWRDLAHHEYIMLFNTFYGGKWTKLSSLTLRFYDVLPIFRAAVFASLQRRGFYRFDPKLARHSRLAGVALTAIIIVLLDITGVVRLWGFSLISALSFLVAGALVYHFGPRITPKTIRATRTTADILGFQMFLNTVAADRMERLPPEIFEKFLPYAMALGVEHHWTHAFEGIALPPSWSDAFATTALDPSHFVDRLLGFTAAAHTAVLSTPRGTEIANRPTPQMAALYSRSGWAEHAKAAAASSSSAQIPD